MIWRRMLGRELMVLACLVLVSCGGEPLPPEAASAPGAAQTQPAVLPALAPMMAVHYFGSAWPKNFIAGFRRADVPADFARISTDGFNAVVLVVSWSDFQPDVSPCCLDDERAWERLRFLLDQAQRAKLQVVLRVGFPHSFHPLAGDIDARLLALTNEAGARADYQRFVKRLGREIAGHPEVVLAFMSWEDQHLTQITEAAREDYRAFAATRPELPWAPGAALPTREGEGADAFNAYWDWMVIEKLYRPSLASLPMLSYEARVDRDPYFTVAADGTRRLDHLIAHPGMLRLPAGQPVTIYWAPYWGAENRGEKLSAARSLVLFEALIADVRSQTGSTPIFIDQFNVLDNSLGFETNAAISADEIPAFLSGVVCPLKANPIAGLAWWAGRDYAESPIFNPAFGYGLDGWARHAVDESQAALESMPLGDFRVRLHTGDAISQVIPALRGRLPNSDGDAYPDRTCITADAQQPATVTVQAGSGRPARLRFNGNGVQTQCSDIQALPTPDRSSLTVEVRAVQGDVALQDVKVFDHVQTGGLYAFDGQPGPLLASVRRLNAEFLAASGPARCSVPSAAPAPTTN